MSCLRINSIKRLFCTSMPALSGSLVLYWWILLLSMKWWQEAPARLGRGRWGSHRSVIPPKSTPGNRTQSSEKWSSTPRSFPHRYWKRQNFNKRGGGKRTKQKPVKDFWSVALVWNPPLFPNENSEGITEGKLMLLSNSRPGNTNSLPLTSYSWSLSERNLHHSWTFTSKSSFVASLLRASDLLKFTVVFPLTPLNFGAGPQGAELFGASMLFAYKDFFSYIWVCM